MLGFWKRTAYLSAAALSIASSVSAARALGIKNGKIAVTSPDGLSDATYTLKQPAPLPSTIELGEGGTLKFTFTAIDTSSGQGVYPKHAHLLFEDLKGEEDVTLPVTIKENGKASFTINTAKTPSALLESQGQFALTLLLSTFDQATAPLSYPLGHLTLPTSILKPIPRKRHDLPPRAGEPAFQPQQEVFHTFKDDPKTVGYGKSVIGTGIVLAPWIVLLALIGKISGSLDFKSPSLSGRVFVAALALLEGWTMYYWIGMKIYQFLPVFLVLGAVTAYIGKVALGEMRAQRLRAGGKP